MIIGRLLPLLLVLFPAFVLADLELDQEDVPSQCRSICEPVANLTRTCDVDDGSMSDEQEDLLERQCICTNDSFDVANRTALCASCIGQGSGNGTTGNGTTGNNGTSNSTGQSDINSIMSVCGFSSQSFASNMTTATSANVTATRPSGTGALTTTISTGVAQPTDGGGGVGGGGGPGSPDETAAPGAGARAGVSDAGILGALFAGVMMGL